MAAAFTTQDASDEQALAGTTAVLGGLLISSLLAWAAGTTIMSWDPTTMLLLASVLPVAVIAQFSLNTTAPPKLPVKAALRFTALALGMICVVGSAVGMSGVSFLGLMIPPAAMAALVVLAATSMAGLGYSKLQLGETYADARITTSTSADFQARTLKYEATNDRAAMRDFDRRLSEALKEVDIELDFEVESQRVECLETASAA